MEQTKHVKPKSKYGPKTNIKSIKKLNRQHWNPKAIKLRI